MIRKLIWSSTFGILFIAMIAFGQDGKDTQTSKEAAENEHKHEEGEGHEHKEGEKDGHDHGGEGDEHGHEEEEAGNVGPEKGILEVTERNGFKLSPEALKNFDLKLMKLTGDGPWPIPKTALVHSGEEVNVFRLRKGFFKRVDFESSKKGELVLTIDSDDLREDDEIVLQGLGFLRIAELASSGGIAHGHSH